MRLEPCTCSREAQDIVSLHERILEIHLGRSGSHFGCPHTAPNFCKRCFHGGLGFQAGGPFYHDCAHWSRNRDLRRLSARKEGTAMKPCGCTAPRTMKPRNPQPIL